MSVPIRRRFHTTDTTKVEELRKLQALKIIEIVEEKYQHCKNCNTKIIVDENFLHEGLKTRPVCKKTARLASNNFSEFKISKLNYKQIAKICSQELNRTIGENKLVFDKDRRCWIYLFKGKNVPVVISDFSSYNQYVNNILDLCWLCIVIDWEENKGKLNNYNTLNFVRIEDILQHKINLSEQIELDSYYF